MKRGGPIRRYTAPRRVSKKRVAMRVEREQVRLRVLERAEGVCEACPRLHDGPVRRAVDVHEVLSRARGGDPLDEDGCLALCRPCHRWAHDNPEAAARVGLLKHSWDAA